MTSLIPTIITAVRLHWMYPVRKKAGGAYRTSPTKLWPNIRNRLVTGGTDIILV